jgi:hypothetical protein
MTSDDATPFAAALAFWHSGGYKFSTLDGGADVHFLRQIRFCTGIGGTLPRRANRSRPNRPCKLLDPRLARGLRGHSDRRSEFD